MRIEWPTLGLIALCYSVWAAAGAWLWPEMPVLALIIMTVMAALHSSLVHECLHGHPTGNRYFNEALVTLPLSVLFPYRRFQDTHLEHHTDERLTDPFDDPESYYKALWRHSDYPHWFQAVLRANNTLIGRLVIGPWLQFFGFLMSDALGVWRNQPGLRLAWAIHIPALVLVLAVVSAFGIPLWLYLVAVWWPSAALISLRTFAEHQWHESPEGRTIIVERSPLSWLYLNNNLHIVHHKMPGAPWYQLPALYRAQKDHWQALNEGYVFPNYTALFRNWAFVAKEPVVHPALRRDAGDAGA